MIALSNLCLIQTGWLRELDAQNTFAVRAVKKDGVPAGFPDRNQLDTPRAVKAEKDPAGCSAFFQDAFGEVKGSDLQFVLLAKLLLDVVSQILEIPDLHRVSLHVSDHSSMTGRQWAILSVTKDRQIANRVCYRQNGRIGFALNNRELCNT
jgi:hypothetical protein